MPQPLHALTEREVEVLKLVARGLSNAEIGKRLRLSTTSVGRATRELGYRDIAVNVGVRKAGGRAQCAYSYQVIT